MFVKKTGKPCNIRITMCKAINGNAKLTYGTSIVPVECS